MSNVKQAEDVIRESEERYRALVENTHDLICETSINGRFLYVSPRHKDVLGYEPDELVGRSIFDNIHPSDRSTVIEEFWRAVNSFSSGQVTFRYKHKNGRWVWLESTGRPFQAASGEIRGVIASRDITERKQAEEKMRERAELLDKARDAIAVRDLENNIIYWNKGAERLYVWKAEEIMGRKADELFYKKEDLPLLTEAKKILMEKGEWIGELRQVTKDGREIITESRWTLVRDSEEKPKSVLVVNTDITEKKKLESQLLHAQRMESIGILAGGIAHDLNNVLHPITMALQLLRGKLTDEQSQKWIDTLEASAERGANLVKQILSFARGTEGERTVIQVRYIISEIERIIRETFPRSIEIRTDVTKDLWDILGDVTQINQVLMNICVNARDAMPNGGRLSISAGNLFIDESYARMNIEAKVGPYVVITVSDTGIGIPADIINRIFEPFFTTKEVGKGTGLGLSTAFGIVKGHGGFIDVYSEVGKGATFKVYLPAIETTEIQKARAKDKDIEDLPLGHGELILVVDDEASVCEIARATLEAYGYRVITASDGAEAVAVYVRRGDEVSVVIMDMMMPIMDGRTSITAIRRVNPEARVIAVSGLMEKEKLDELRNIDVQAFLSKPYTAETLLRTLHEVLRK